jgi:BlaI family transcriptional regulator, penicillinase repressor
MKMDDKRRLTRGDLQILQMLWRQERVTIAGAHQALGLPISYSTVQTRLNRLVGKGLVRKTKETPTRYEAAIQPQDVVESELRTLVQDVSGGVVPLVAQLFREHQPSRAELDEIRQLIRQAETRHEQRRRR